MVLGVMFYQDLKFRAIYWWLFPLLFVFLFTYSARTAGWLAVLDFAAWNSLFVLFQVILLTAYISLRSRKFTNIFSGYFGLGDLLFLICIAGSFSLLNFVCFYVVSLLISIMIMLFVHWFSRSNQQKIPLAGYQALLLIAVLLFDALQSDWNMLSVVSVEDFCWGG